MLSPSSFSIWVSLLLGLCYSYHALAAPQVYPDLRSLLTDPARGWSPNTTLLFPGSPGFGAATERWTIFRPPTYQAVIRPGSEEDVGRIIKLATSHGIPFLARGAGHGYSPTLGDIHDGLSLDLGQLKRLSIDRDAQTLTVGPAVTFEDIFDPVFNAGFQIQTGTCSCPSMIGVTLGGGVGRLQGELGLMIDALVSVRMITAQGQLIEVSQRSYPDLFWGIRGAGANFGVITSATYKMHPLINNGDVLNADLYFPPTMSSEYFKTLESLNNKLPAKLASITFVIWNNATNQTQLAANWVYYGPEEEGRRALASILALKPPLSIIRSVPWNKLTSTSGGNFDQTLCEGNAVRSFYSLNQKNYSASGYQWAFEKMTKFFAEHPGGRKSALSFELFPNQNAAAVRPDETAYPWRDATGFIVPSFSWEIGDDATAKAAGELGLEMRNELSRTAGYNRLSCFVNYARGDEGLESIYGSDKLPRLAKLKKAWDPSNVFGFYHSLPLVRPAARRRA